LGVSVTAAMLSGIGWIACTLTVASTACLLLALAGLAAHRPRQGSCWSAEPRVILLRQLLLLVDLLPPDTTVVGLRPSIRRWSERHAPPADRQPERELAVLTSPELGKAIEAAGIELCRWADRP
jgi:hypothetical protein